MIPCIPLRGCAPAAGGSANANPPWERQKPSLPTRISKPPVNTLREWDIPSPSVSPDGIGRCIVGKIISGYEMFASSSKLFFASLSISIHAVGFGC